MLDKYSFWTPWWWFSGEVVSNSCDSMDYSLPGSSVHGILQARILEWVAISFSRVFFRPRNQARVSCIAGRFFTNWAMRENIWAPYHSFILCVFTYTLLHWVCTCMCLVENGKGMFYNCSFCLPLFLTISFCLSPFHLPVSQYVYSMPLNIASASVVYFL